MIINGHIVNSPLVDIGCAHCELEVETKREEHKSKWLECWTDPNARVNPMWDTSVFIAAVAMVAATLIYINL